MRPGDESADILSPLRVGDPPRELVQHGIIAEWLRFSTTWTTVSS